RAAIEEGVLPGGGVALLRAIPALEKLEEKLEEDEKTGLRILKKSLEIPIRLIAENAGFDGAVVVEEVKKNKGAFGFNAQTMKYEDLMASGIVDPTKVVRSALENAASAASMFLITEAVVGEYPEKEEKSKMPSMPEEY
ncbi:MAG: molecular chaperone GroEL, partial [Candidatus Nealsonbacteria bacterium CG_4_8_14_3_um_filter_37_23]